MIPFAEARAAVLAGVTAPSPPVDTPLELAAGRVLAVDVVAPGDVPPFANSAMDGYAVRADDVQVTPVELRVTALSTAGRPADRAVGPGEAARILTGAVMVDGADAVVPVEHTSGEFGVGGVVTVSTPVGPGANVRGAGEDARAGDVVLTAGTVLAPGHVGVAASVGRSELPVHPAPRVAIVSTGDELVHPAHGPLGPGQIFDSNRFALAAALEQRCAVTDVTMLHAADDPQRLRHGLRELAGSVDVILSSGGVSMGGEYDVVKAALRDGGDDGDEDIAVEFVQVAIKPAKPLAYGRIGGAHFVGLPGNPVSSLVSFELFVVPLVRALSGRTPAVPPWSRAVLGAPLHRNDDAKTHFVRVRRRADGTVVPSGAQGSHVLTAMASATHLAVLPPDRGGYVEGDEVDVVDLGVAGVDAAGPEVTR